MGSMNLNVYILRFDQLSNQIPEKLRQAVSGRKSVKDRWQAVLSEHMVLYVLSKELNTNAEYIKIEKNKYGKPFCFGRFFNVSHSGSVLVLATDDSPIGIDVEFVRPLDDVILLAEFFAPSEKGNILAAGEMERNDLFFKYWTMKESYIKAIGEGIRKFDSPIEPGWYFKRYDLLSEYECVVCARHECFPEYPKLIQISDLFAPTN